MSRFENFTPPTLGSELTTTEITMVEEITALANSASGEFIRKSGGSLVNATLSETMALAGLSDVTISSVAQGAILYYNGTAWVNLAAGTTGFILQTQGAGANPSWVNPTVGSGTVTSVSVVSANGVSGTVATETITPAITLTLGAITPTSVTGMTDITVADGGTGSSTPGGARTNLGLTYIEETASGAINGSNVTYTLSQTPTVFISLELARQSQVYTTDYTRVTTTITYVAAPDASLSGQPHIAKYFY